MTDLKVKSQVYDGLSRCFYRPHFSRTPVQDCSGTRTPPAERGLDGVDGLRGPGSERQVPHLVNALHGLDGVSLEQQTLVEDSGRTPDSVQNQREVLTHVAQCR